MPWKPSTDLEEEILNLQPDHDFIFGALSEPEPQPFYPRPKSHIDYAATRKKQSKNRQEQFEATGRINDPLHVISQVQRIAGTKPLGEQPTLQDWATDKDTEKEVVAMMRHFGLGPSVEERLDAKVTIATFPVKKSVEVVQNGRKKVPLFFDDNLFKLKPRVSNSSSSESTRNSLISANSTDSSLNVSSSSCDTNSQSYSTAGGLDMSDLSDTNCSGSTGSMTNYKKAQIDRHSLLLQSERLRQYDKLHENSNSTLDSFSLDTSCAQEDSFRTALEEYTTDTERRVSSDVEETNIKEFISNSKHQFNNTSNFINTQQNSFEEECSVNSVTKPPSLLQRFLKNPEESRTTSPRSTSRGSLGASSSSSSSSPVMQNGPPTYAHVTRKSASTTTNPSATKSSLIQPPPNVRFYTPRELYERKRRILK